MDADPGILREGILTSGSSQLSSLGFSFGRTFLFLPMSSSSNAAAAAAAILFRQRDDDRDVDSSDQTQSREGIRVCGLFASVKYPERDKGRKG